MTFILLQLVFATDVHIRFQLLDVAPMHGDVNTYAKETPLDMAAKALEAAINGNRLVIPLYWDSHDNVSCLPSLTLTFTKISLRALDVTGLTLYHTKGCG